MKIEFRIMGVMNRRGKYILPMLKKLNMDESIVFYDEHNGAKKNALSNARKAWTAETDADFVCVLQDDLLLSDQFIQVAYECAKNFPNSIFSFFNTRIVESEASSKTPYVKTVGCGVWGQAIMIPCYMIKPMFFWIDENYGKDYKHDDIAIGFFVSMNGIDVMTTVPGIVQHLAHNESTLGYNNKNKVSHVFKESVDIGFFRTRKYIKSRYMPNSPIKPKDGYKHGKLLTMSELMQEVSK